MVLSSDPETIYSCFEVIATDLTKPFWAFGMSYNSFLFYKSHILIILFMWAETIHSLSDDITTLTTESKSGSNYFIF